MTVLQKLVKYYGKQFVNIIKGKVVFSDVSYVVDSWVLYTLDSFNGLVDVSPDKLWKDDIGLKLREGFSQHSKIVWADWNSRTVTYSTLYEYYLALQERPDILDGVEGKDYILDFQKGISKPTGLFQGTLTFEAYDGDNVITKGKAIDSKAGYEYVIQSYSSLQLKKGSEG